MQHEFFTVYYLRTTVTNSGYFFDARPRCGNEWPIMNVRAIGEIRPGTRVLVTGAARGIGLSIAAAFHQHGARVHVCDADPEAVAELKEKHSHIHAIVADIASESDVDRLFGRVLGSLNGLDVLVNNAGISGPTAPIQDIEPSDWLRTVDVDLNGQFYCLRKAIPLLLNNDTGSIVNIVSNAGVFGYPLRTPYTACKWAMVGLTKTLAMELGPSNIRVNAICPGSVEGSRIDGVIQREAEARGVTPEQVRQSYLRQSSMRTFVSAEDVANMVLFLCSDLGSRVSGQVLGVDGHTETLAQF